MEEYVVEAIRSWRYNLEMQRKEYLIKWQNYGERDNTWEPEDNMNCPEILQKFVEGLDKRQARYYNTDRPDKLTGFERNAQFEACYGADAAVDSPDEADLDSTNKPKFYCLLKFDDSDDLEEVTLDEFYINEPEAALQFLERRIILEEN